MSAPQPLDVVVIGAGIVGLMAARALLADGRHVTVLDRGDPGRGASYGNAGVLAFSEVLPIASPGILLQAPKWLLDPLGPLSVPPANAPRVAPWLWRFVLASRAGPYRRATQAQGALMGLARTEMEAAIAAAGLAAHVSKRGMLELYDSERELKAAQEELRIRRAAGFEIRDVGPEEIASLQPGLAARFAHGTFHPDGLQVGDPYLFASALADHLRERGVVIRRAEAAAVETAGPGRGPGATVRLADGETLSAKAAVVAAGAWSKTLAAGLGDPVPLDTERGYNTTLPPDAFPLERQITFASHGFVVSPLSSGIRVGGAVELGGLKAPPNFRRAEAMLAKAKTFLPGLCTDGGRQWMGFRPSMPDSLPVIGHARRSPAVVYAFGHGHLGLTQSAGTGRLVADLVSGRPPAIPLEPYRPGRFFRNS